MSLAFNYRHLYYFWIVAKEGGMSRAAARLDMAVQTVSAQVRELEKDLGCQLLKPAGRGLALTEAGVAALGQAEHIFQLGETLPDLVRSAAQVTSVRLTAGIADGLPKLVVQRLLQPILATPDLRLVCHEGEMSDLLADLAVHRLDVVLADHPAPFNPHLKVHNHPVGTSGMGWYASRQWWAAARRGFPASLDKVPVLLPTTHSSVRGRLDHWLSAHSLRPRASTSGGACASCPPGESAGICMSAAPEGCLPRCRTLPPGRIRPPGHRRALHARARKARRGLRPDPRGSARWC